MRTNKQLLSLELVLKELSRLDAKVSGIALKEGPQGLPGEKGEPGIVGESGEDGINGVDGRDGVDGKDGKQGPAGPRGPAGKDGKDGVDGKDGNPGEPGRDGKDGSDGKDGVDGADGKDGASIERLEIKNNKLFVKIEKQPLVEVGKLPVHFAGGGGMRGPKGDKGDAAGIQINTSIAVSATEKCDEVDTSIVASVKWTITVIDDVTDEKSVAEVMAIDSNGTPRHNEYARIFKDVKIDIDVLLNAGKLELFIENKDTNAITAHVIRTETQR
jgi:hypothetical protein